VSAPVHRPLDLAVHASTAQGVSVASANITLWAQGLTSTPIESAVTNSLGDSEFRVAVPQTIVGHAEENGTSTPVYGEADYLVQVDSMAGVGFYGFSVNSAGGHSMVENVNVIVAPLTHNDAVVPAQSGPCTTGDYYTWKYTPIVSFSIQSGVEAGYNFPSGAKIAEPNLVSIGSPGGGCPPDTWTQEGTDSVTLGVGIQNNVNLAGSKNYTINLDIEYINQVELDPTLGYYWMNSWAYSTNNDYTRTSSSFSPSSYPIVSGCENGQYTCTDIASGDQRSIPVTGGSNFVFSIDVGFSYPTGVTAGFSISTTPAAQSTVTISNPQSNGVYAWIYDAESNYLNSYAELA
jgi:hypothetical protein